MDTGQYSLPERYNLIELCPPIKRDEGGYCFGADPVSPGAYTSCDTKVMDPMTVFLAREV